MQITENQHAIAEKLVVLDEILNPPKPGGLSRQNSFNASTSPPDLSVLQQEDAAIRVNQSVLGAAQAAETSSPKPGSPPPAAKNEAPRKKGLFQSLFG